MNTAFCKPSGSFQKNQTVLATIVDRMRKEAPNTKPRRESEAWHECDYTIIIGVARRIPDKILQEDAKLLMCYD